MRKQRTNTHAKREPNRWQASAQWREIGRAAITAWNAKRPLLPKCGAKRKRDGEPCRQLAMANGRCFVHGGRTPKGDDWHRPRWPNGKAPDAEKKLRRKLRDQQRAAKKRVERLAAMTPDERARYENWYRSHRPGSAADRARRRQERRTAAEMRQRRSAPDDRPENPEAAQLREHINRLEVKRDALQAIVSENEPDPGVFG